MYILPRIKNISAVCLAVILTVGTYSLTQNENSVTISASKAVSDYEQQLSDLSAKQKELEEKIANANDSINSQQSKLNDVSEQMNVISEKIKTSEKYSKQIEDELCDLDEKTRDSQTKLSDQEKQIKKGVNDFSKRIRAMYLAGSNSYTEVLANSSDFYDVLMRMELIKSVAKHDNDTIDSLVKQKKDIDKTKSQLESQSNELKEKSKQYSEQQKSLSEEYTKLVDLKNTYGESISKLEGEKQSYQNEIDSVIAEYSKVSTSNKSTTASSERMNPTTDARRETTRANTTQTQKPATQQTTKKQTTSATQTTSKPTPAPSNDSSYQSKIDTLMATARSMVGGAYVWGGSSPYATDCSGLTMQCYAKIGISLPHLASGQAYYGSSVSYSNMLPGDLIFFGGSSYDSIYHVAIYIGDGKMIHAENSYTGIVVSYVGSFSQYNNITCIKRLI